MLKIYPAPIKVTQRVESFTIPESISITGCTDRLRLHAEDLFADLDIDLVEVKTSDTQVELLKQPVSLEGHGAYVLTIDMQRIRIESETEEGFAYGLASLAEVFYLASISDSKLVNTAVISDAEDSRTEA